MSKDVLSWQQFLDSGFDGRDYKLPESDGDYDAVIACKRWGRKETLCVYLDLIDGRKIIAVSWENTDYLGLKKIPVGAQVKVSFQTSSKGVCYLKAVEEM